MNLRRKESYLDWVDRYLYIKLLGLGRPYRAIVILYKIRL